LAGFMARDDFFQQAHVVVLCSNMENLPYTILEAMAWSRPVVATRVGGLPDLVDDGATGFLVAPDDAADLAGRLIRLANDGELRNKMGEMGRYKLESEFEVDQMVAKHLDVYQSLAPRKP
jgi:glycosyltransferase involved in cell wall biosynthesis